MRLAFVCPLCRRPLLRSPKALGCAEGHSYDVARAGYVNLLVRPRASLLRAADTAAMVEARRRFLGAGHYEPIRDRLVQVTPARAELVDVGCGEGYYSRVWAAEAMVGIDISKPAVGAAARASPLQLRHAVASAFDLPLADASCDAAWVVFGPMAPEEMVRVLRPGGVLVVVRPGPGHLAELRHRLGVPPRREPRREPMLTGFERCDVMALEYRIALGAADAGALAVMSPWRPAAAWDPVPLEVAVASEITVWRRL